MEKSLIEQLRDKSISKKREILQTFIDNTVNKCILNAKIRADYGYFSVEITSDTIPNVISNKETKSDIIDHISIKLQFFDFKKITVIDFSKKNNFENLESHLLISFEW